MLLTKRMPFNRLLPALLLLLALFAIPQTAFGHASLVSAVPEPNSRMDQSPPEIALTFNERIEEKLFYIKVLDESGRAVATDKAQMNDGKNGLTLKLPVLANGPYVVTYHIISADGHPVDDSFLITVGPPSSAAISGGQHEHKLSWSNLGFTDALKYASRIVNYLILLALAGWVAWSAILRRTTSAMNDRLEAWRIGLGRGYVISLLALIYFHYQELLGEGGASELLGLFTGTSIGLSWMASLALALLGFFILSRKAAIDFVWAGLLLAAKSFNGHAMAFDPRLATLPMDWIHLTAAAVWVGGLAMVAVFWRSDAVRELLVPKFSRAAFASIVVLTLSGIVSAMLFLPDLTYVFYSQWGTLLLIKTGLVVLVLIVAGTIRWQLRGRQTATARLLLRIDLALMALIVGLVGLLTYLAPVPANQPLNWHIMGEKVHVTARITPNAPGTNNFVVKIWLPQKLGKPKYVELNLISNDKAIAPIPVPIEPFDDQELDAMLDYARYSFKASGPYMPFAGSWTVEVRVMDSNDDETVYKETMRIF